MTQQLLALRAWTAETETAWTSMLGKWSWSPVAMLQRMTCAARGHVTILCSQGNHITLRCMHCGHTTRGWKVGPQAMATMVRDAGTHLPATRSLSVAPMSSGWRTSLNE